MNYFGYYGGLAPLLFAELGALDSHPSQLTLRMVRRTHLARGGRY